MAEKDFLENNALPNPHAEIEAMGLVARALENLDSASRDRVLDWALKFYRKGASLKTGSSAQAGASASVSSESLVTRTMPDDLASLFAEARPGTDAEKALVGAYFLAADSGLDEFDSFTLNSSLTHLGHRVGNITRALTALSDARPALVVQTRKEGKSKQARKKFKITVEGRRRVEQMRTSNGKDDT
jgi:hypothetical protein